MQILPRKLQPFSKSLSNPDFDAWVHFYEEDYKFSKFKKNPEAYLSHLSKFPGVITPDASIGWCDSLKTQRKNAEFNTGCANLFEKHGLNCIRNVRYGDAKSYDFCFKNVPNNSILAIGTHGALRRADYRLVLQAGLDELCTIKSPHTLLIYGYTPKDIFQKHIDSGIKVIRYPSEFELSHGGSNGT